MAHSNQAKKRIRQNERSRLRNKTQKSACRTFIKKTLLAVEQQDLEQARSLLPLAMRNLDKAAKHNTIHRNAASRQKSRLSRKVAHLEKQLAGPASP